MNNTHFPPATLLSLLPPQGYIYFVGILGVSMSGLAHLAKSRGYIVSGCDRNTASPAADALHADGIRIEKENEANPQGAALVVYSLAISPTSPAIVYARTHGIPLVSRADFLAAITRGFRHRIAIAGMHGKSTTTGMLAAILQEAERYPTVLSGAPLAPHSPTYLIGDGDTCLVEACEYRNSFLSLRPTLGIVTNIELDHPDFFPNMTAVEDSFSRFLWQCDNAVIGGDCPALDALAEPNLLRFGTSPSCALCGTPVKEGMVVAYHGTTLGTIPLSVPGAYNRENALAATAAALTLNIPFSTIRKALAAFRGVGRRMEYAGEISTADGGQAAVFSDYAHHPTELVACISAARERGGRILAVFQPHTYTRTRALWREFISALSLPDAVVLVDIYAAREAAIDGTSSMKLAKAAGVHYAPSLADAAARLRAAARGGDTILVLGAGDIDRILPCLLQ